jgi:hypothetical protein
MQRSFIVVLPALAATLALSGVIPRTTGITS